MKLRALFDYPPWAKGEIFEIDPVAATLLCIKQPNHFEAVVILGPGPEPEPPEPVPVVDIDPWPAPLPAAAAVDEPQVTGFDEPPADKMIHKPRRKK